MRRTSGCPNQCFVPSGVSEVESVAQSASDELVPLVYDELHRLAIQKLSREKPGQTLQPTALVHEAYLRLVEGGNQRWDDTGHFLAAAAEAMRRILVERARRKQRAKYGGGRNRLTLQDDDLTIDPPSAELLALNEALEKLAAADSQTANLVKLRYFAGLTLQEAADALNLPPRTADRHWAYARTWLYRQINKGDRRC